MRPYLISIALGAAFWTLVLWALVLGRQARMLIMGTGAMHACPKLAAGGGAVEALHGTPAPQAPSRRVSREEVSA